MLNLMKTLLKNALIGQKEALKEEESNDEAMMGEEGSNEEDELEIPHGEDVTQYTRERWLKNKMMIV
ncbi:unnamed protein product [Linum trigynum]|uniref:Uncharacterized protein n=1 Tax=Linum trigynum TaxID=586398 RepID=A0AAV2DGT9_9ROSI